MGSTMGNGSDHQQKIKNYSSFLREMSKKHTFSHEDIKDILEKLIDLGVETENYSKQANKTAQTLDRSIKTDFSNYLDDFVNNNPIDASIDSDELDRAFTAFYLLVYYEREYEEMTQLGITINAFQDYFVNYALTSQIKGRYLRRVGKEREALVCDKVAKRKLDEKGISNVWVDITYASSISILMEKRDSSLTRYDIDSCIESIAVAKERHADYAKLNYLYGKLKMFSLVNGDNNKSFEECKQIINEAKEELRMAIEKEDKNKDYYSLSVIEYKSYIRQADLILAELRLRSSIVKQSEELVNEIDTRFNKQQAKNMELLAIFSSIVAIIVVAIGLFSKEYPLKSILTAIIVMNLCVLAVYSTILLLLDDEQDDGYRKLKYLFVLLSAAGIVFKLITMA